MPSSTYYDDDASQASSKPRHRHRSRTSKHRKHRRDSKYESDSGSDTPVEEVVEEREYYDPVTNTRTREVDRTEYKERRSSRYDDDGESVATETTEKSGRRRRHRHRKDRSEVDSEVVDPALAAGGAVAGADYLESRRRRDRDLDGSEYSAPSQPEYPGTVAVTNRRSSKYYDDDSDSDDSRPSRASRSERSTRSKRSKSVGETALAALGLGTLANSRSKSRRRRYDDGSDSEGSYRSTRSTRSKSHKGNSAEAAILAAAVEAFRARKEPGGLTGEKGLKRIVEAAVASGLLEQFLGRKGRDEGKSSKHILEAVLGGVTAQRVVNGPRADSGHDTIRDLIASGVIAAAGKAIIDKTRSKSVDRDRRSDGHRRSSRTERPRLGDRKRSRSVGDYLAMAGIGGPTAAEMASSRGGDSDSSSSNNTSSRSTRNRGTRSRGIDDNESRSSRKKGTRSREIATAGVPDTAGYYDAGNTANSRGKRDYDVIGYTPTGELALAERRDRDGDDSDSLSCPDSEDEHKEMKALRRKQLLGALLATVGSADFASRLYESKQKRAERQEALENGEISQEDFDKQRTKRQLKDTVTLGLLVLGASEFYKSWKEVVEARKSYKERCDKYEEHHKLRQKREAEKQHSNVGPIVNQYIMPPPPGGSAGMGVIPPAGTYPYNPMLNEGATQPIYPQYDAGNRINGFA